MPSTQKMLLIIFATIGGLLFVAAGLFQLSKSRTFQFFGGLTSRVETTENVVAITFDDGPTPHTTDVLDILAAHDVDATFYVIGRDLAANPAIGRDIVARGHELGNHSLTHPRFLLVSPAKVRQEIDETNRLISEAGHAGEITFRPPYGKKLLALPWYLRQQGMRTVTWDVEPDSYFAGDADRMVEYALESTRPGSIILLHPSCGDACAADRAALPRIIEGLRAQGYRFATVSELLTLQR